MAIYMHLHLYLFRKNITSFEECIDDEYLSKDSKKSVFKEVRIKKNSALNDKSKLKAYKYISPSNAPQWLKLITPHFEINEEEMKSSQMGFLLILKIDFETEERSNVRKTSFLKAK